MSDPFRTVEPHAYYHRDQPNGIGAMLFVRDTLNGNRYVTIDKVVREGREYFAVVGDKKVNLRFESLYINWGVVKTHGLPAIASDTFDSLNAFVHEEDVRELLDDPDRYDTVNKCAKLLEIIGGAADKVLEDAATRRKQGQRVPDPLWLKRVEVIRQLITVIEAVETADYEGIRKLLADISTEVEYFDGEVKRIIKA